MGKSRALISLISKDFKVFPKVTSALRARTRIDIALVSPAASKPKKKEKGVGCPTPFKRSYARLDSCLIRRVGYRLVFRLCGLDPIDLASDLSARPHAAVNVDVE